MGKQRVFIDGQQGATGIRIREMLAPRDDIELIQIPSELRKDPAARAEHLNQADLAVLCLPDEAAAQAVELIDNDTTRVIDTSSARRTDPDWVYGLPELAAGHRDAIRAATRVANPGCYPQTFVLGVRPLIEAGVLSPATAFTVNAVSGYSGGGRPLVEAYEKQIDGTTETTPLCLYGLDGRHKHLPEMAQFSLAEHTPMFVPSVDHIYCGMLVSVPLPVSVLNGLERKRVHSIWAERYADEPFVIPVAPEQADAELRDGRWLDLGGCNHTNRLELRVFGREDPGPGLVLVGRLDNLGKGAAGNAVQCLNLMLGLDERTGLTA